MPPILTTDKSTDEKIVALAREVDRLKGEVMRLQRLLRQHNIPIEATGGEAAT